MSGDSPDIGVASSPAAPLPVSAAELDRRRTTYYVLFFSQIPLVIALRLVEDPIAAGILLLVTVAWLVAFEWAFLKAARLAGLSVGALVPIAVLLLVPLVGLVTLLLVDFKIADTVDRGRGQAGKPKLSRLSYWSLIMAWLPVIGLLMAAIALWRIGSSRGMLTGRGLAIAGFVVNALFTLLIVAAIVAPLIRGG